MRDLITTFMLAGRRGRHYAARVFLDGQLSLACLCPSLNELATLHRYVADALGGGLPIAVEGDEEAIAIALGQEYCVGVVPIAFVAAPGGPALPAEPDPADVLGALTAPAALEALEEAGLGRLDTALAGALVRLRAWRSRSKGETSPLVVAASVDNLRVPWRDRADYVLTVDQPWPPALEAFRELFAGAREGADVRLDYRDEKERVIVRPLASTAE